MQLFGFHVTPVCFALREVDFYTVTGCFLYSPPGLQAHLSCISQGYASAGLYPARFSSALTHSAPRLHDGTPSPPSTQHAFERVTIQELLHHLHIAHFRHRPRFIHPRHFIHLRQRLSPPPRLARNLKYLTILKNVSGMCCFSLATSSRCVSLSVDVSPVLWSR